LSTVVEGQCAVTTKRGAHVDLVPLEEIPARLRATGHSVGKQRMVIVGAVEKMESAFTVDELAAAAPEVHVATVYRTLAVLEEIGAVRHVHLSHGPAVYEHSECSEVCHLVCEVCGRHVGVAPDVFDPVRERLATEHDFVLDGSHFAIVGRCGAHLRG